MKTLKKYWQYISGALVGLLLIVAGVWKLILDRQNQKSEQRVTDTASKMRIQVAEDHIDVVEAVAVEVAKEEAVKDEVAQIVTIEDDQARVDALAASITSMRHR